MTKTLALMLLLLQPTQSKLSEMKKASAEEQKYLNKIFLVSKPVTDKALLAIMRQGAKNLIPDYSSLATDISKYIGGRVGKIKVSYYFWVDERKNLALITWFSAPVIKGDRVVDKIVAIYIGVNKTTKNKEIFLIYRNVIVGGKSFGWYRFPPEVSKLKD